MQSIPVPPLLRGELREERKVRQLDAQLEDEHGLAARVGDEERLRVPETALRHRTPVLGGRRHGQSWSTGWGGHLFRRFSTVLIGHYDYLGTIHKV